MAARKKKSTELLPQDDPQAPLDGAALLTAAKPVLKALEDDLLARADASPGVTTALKERHALEKKAQRTADNYQTWRRAFIEQVAAAWFLGVVFVRTLEDRGLIERNRIAGPGALDSQKGFFTLAPSLSERDYLLTVFKELAHLPAAADLFDAKHNPVWLLGPSAEAAQKLLALFRTGSDEHPAFRFGGDTRFLGDLYQDLSENVRKRYALLQTPRFVESYILDKTLEPALQKFGLDDTTLIDPTCGSGHFLLGAFERLFQHRLEAEPGIDVRQAAKKALDAVSGADINPYAISIARFRLTLAFLEAGKIDKLKAAPKLPIHLAVADSLLHNAQKGLEKGRGPTSGGQLAFGDDNASTIEAWQGHLFALEDPAATQDVLGRRYAAVVGNPPYITVKDAVLRERYRAMYPLTCSGKYSLAAPFSERFFQLGRDAAAVGMITAISFMKREFGKKLIQEYLPSVNLTSIVNTSGAYIPGHGTPTVLLFGTSEAPLGDTVHTVLASRGEPSTPDDPEQGLVWRSIADHGNETGFENDYISVTETSREDLKAHPWSLSGGGATDLKALLEERAETTLGDLADSIGIASFTLEDEVFLRPRQVWERAPIPQERMRQMVTGECIRDWSIEEDLISFFPYDADFQVIPEDSPELKALWPWRTNLANNFLFGGKTKVQGGLKWHEFGRLTASKLRTPLTITFAFVATHNHFVLDRGGKVFNRTAPIIKLPASATEDDHYALLAYLNSSTAQFWCRQVMSNRGYGADSGNARTTACPWEDFYEYAGGLLKGMPVYSNADATECAKNLDRLAEERQEELSKLEPSADILDALMRRMAALQEKIDWYFYREAGLVNSIPEFSPTLSLGSRQFERVLAQRGDPEGWLLKNGYRCTSAPDDWYSSLLNQNSSLRLLERAEFKRRWAQPDVKELAHTAAEAKSWTEVEAKLSALRAPESVRNARLETAAVPFLACLRFLEKGLEKHAEWQHTWELQRCEDAGEPIGEIPVPPKYDSKDFRSPTYWRLRGKLDVPKERFISYPGCESDEDGEPVYGWAGWNHRQRAVALATLYSDRKNDEGWSKERLQPMLAGILELLPWLEQWHNQPDEEFDGAIPAVQFREFLDAECAEHGFTYDDLRAWRPSSKKSTAQKSADKKGPANKTAKKRSKRPKDQDEANDEEEASS